LWAEILAAVRPLVKTQTYETWFRGTHGISYDHPTLVVEVPNRFFVEWLEEHLRGVIAEATSTVGRPSLDIRFQASAHGPRRTAYVGPPPVNGTPEPDAPRHDGNLIPRYTFESFVVGQQNQFAHAAARAVADKPAKAYNPLFIKGSVGLGKTHLMHAIGNAIQAQSPHMQVHYASAENFMNEMIQSLQHATTHVFRHKYRSMDVLLVDDVQFLKGKESTQEEFFHTFNALHSARKQIVLTSDRPAKEIPTLEERLVSRFEWGLVVDIQAPDLETRTAIVRKKAEDEGLELDDDVALLVARNVSGNIRELESCLVRLTAHHSINQEPITLELARGLLADRLNAREAELSPEAILKAVAESFQVAVDELKSRRRTQHIAFPRQVAMFLVRELTSLSLAEIGGFFGRDHTTVRHACEKIRDETERDHSLEARISLLRRALKPEPALV
jgi:chromosomal replication initiator protein